jgi:hypothetical protein
LPEKVAGRVVTGHYFSAWDGVKPRR